MFIDPAIFLAALGITTLELAEASAVGIALYAESRRISALLAVAAGVVIIMIPTALAGSFISIFPLIYVRLFSATLLLYFGLRLMKSARRSFRYQREGFRPKVEEREKGLMVTAVSVGAVEAFEAAIVLVALYPNNYDSTLLGVSIGIIAVLVFSFILHSQIRKIKQAAMKVAVSSLLLSFSAFWYVESVKAISDLLLIPLFVIFFTIVYTVSSHGIHAANTRDN
ncbi:MAG: hypothetical protein M1301_04330 [Candidatus Thermoplasmatota archaeon]|jgi:uncharacterized membrane protein|nr:hypothetical protein [Candidatus Thermoplasmatota archaeon]